MTANDKFVAEAQEALRQAPAAAGIAIADPGDGVITKREAQRIFVDSLAVVMAEWFGRGRVDGIVEERERIGRILRHPAAAGRRELAELLAFGRDDSAETAIAALEAAPRDARA